VRRLGREVGVALLHRTARGADPRSPAATLLARAEAALAEVASAREALGRHAGRSPARCASPRRRAGFSPVPLLEVSEPAAVRTSTGSMTRQGGPR
jgi:DNA-binding transcriptional LysR family regulator